MSKLVKESLNERLSLRDISDGNGPKYVLLYNEGGKYGLHETSETLKELITKLERVINPH
jgi:hypothetical protein